MSREQLLDRVLEVFNEELNGITFDLFIFGSQANKEELIVADVDVGIMAMKPIDSTVISRISQKLNDELPTLYSFDVVDFNKVEASFSEVALSNIEFLHREKNNS